jgi:hypothetical protein
VWFGVGLGFCVVLFGMFGLLFAPENGDPWDSFIQLAPWLAHPLVGLTVVATHRSVTRARRDGAEELFESCPTDQPTRTLGFLASALAPVVILTVFLAAVFVALVFRSPRLHGPVSGDNVAEVLAAIALGAGGVALGAALGRWARFALVPMAALFLIQGLALKLDTMGDPGWNQWAPLSTAPALSDTGPIFADRPAWWHLLWILALVAMVGVIAVARHRRDMVVTGAGAMAAVVAITAAFIATRPPGGTRAQAIANLITNPGPHQRCQSVDGPLRVCVYDRYGEMLDRVTGRVAPVSAALPNDVAPITLRQVFNGNIADLAPSIRRKLPDGIPRMADRELPLKFNISKLDEEEAALRFALASVDLPTEPREGVPTVVAGQARGVIALWLTTRGLDRTDALAMATSRAPGGDAFDRGSIEDDPCANPSVVWSEQDLAAARALISLPDARVRSVVADGWSRWSDPATPTDDLMAALGLAPVGPIDHVEPRRRDTC